MADIYTSLMQAVVMKRATLLEQWIVQHKEHYPGPQLQTYADDFTISTARCSCGESIELVIVIGLEARIATK
jgi:hypothetical protein